MLDKNSLKILRWFKEHQGLGYSIYDLKKVGLSVEYLTLDWLDRHDYLSHFEYEDPALDPEYDNPPYLFWISPGGLAKLEERRLHTFIELRAWVTAVIAVAAFVLSAIALVLEYSH